MMYNNKLAVALKSAGKVLREFGETVYVPFGSEYSVLIKNLNSVRVMTTVTIDGEDVGDGTRFVIHPNEDMEIERFIKNGNLTEGNRFKFIERTESVEKHRGVGIEDGIVRVEFNFERPRPRPIYYDNILCSAQPRRRDVYKKSFDNYSAEVKTSNSLGICPDSNEIGVASASCADPGITVPGSVSDQKFREASWFPTETDTHVIILQLLGESEGRQVTKPVTVKAKPKCTTCGRVNKATAKFCAECGTSLTIV